MKFNAQSSSVGLSDELTSHFDRFDREFLIIVLHKLTGSHSSVFFELSWILLNSVSALLILVSEVCCLFQFSSLPPSPVLHLFANILFLNMPQGFFFLSAILSQVRKFPQSIMVFGSSSPQC